MYFDDCERGGVRAPRNKKNDGTSVGSLFKSFMKDAQARDEMQVKVGYTIMVLLKQCALSNILIIKTCFRYAASGLVTLPLPTATVLRETA